MLAVRMPMRSDEVAVAERVVAASLHQRHRGGEKLLSRIGLCFGFHFDHYARRDSNPQPMVPKTIALSS